MPQKPRKKPSRVPPPDWRTHEFLSTIEASAIIKCSPAHLVKLLRTRQLSARWIGGKMLVETASLIALIDKSVSWHDAPHPRGRPPRAKAA